MTRAEADMLVCNGVLDYEKTYGPYHDLSVQEALEVEYGSVAPFIEIDETQAPPRS